MTPLDLLFLRHDSAAWAVGRWAILRRSWEDADKSRMPVTVWQSFFARMLRAQVLEFRGAGWLARFWSLSILFFRIKKNRRGGLGGAAAARDSTRMPTKSSQNFSFRQGLFSFAGGRLRLSLACCRRLFQRRRERPAPFFLNWPGYMSSVLPIPFLLSSSIIDTFSCASHHASVVESLRCKQLSLCCDRMVSSSDIITTRCRAIRRPSL